VPREDTLWLLPPLVNRTECGAHSDYAFEEFCRGSHEFREQNAEQYLRTRAIGGETPLNQLVA